MRLALVSLVFSALHREVDSFVEDFVFSPQTSDSWALVHTHGGHSEEGFYLCHPLVVHYGCLLAGSCLHGCHFVVGFYLHLLVLRVNSAPESLQLAVRLAFREAAGHSLVGFCHYLVQAP